MNFSDLNFFVNMCEDGFFKACSEFSFDERAAIRVLKGLQKYLGVVLFSWEETPSINSLTEKGSLFLKNARKIMADLSEGILEVCDLSKDNNTIVIRSNFMNGKTLILPCIAEIDNSKQYQGINIDLLTYDHINENEDVNDHILFHQMSKSEKLFFDRRWSVKMEQGLYASEGYLMDIRIYPKKPEDLLMNSILALGDAFDREFYNSMNWHLSGEYGLCELEPSIIISSQIVLIAAVEANLGIGPIFEHHEKLGYKKLFRILPEISGPPLIVDFAVRKKLPDRIKECVDEIESKILNKLKEFDLEIVY